MCIKKKKNEKMKKKEINFKMDERKIVICCKKRGGE